MPFGIGFFANTGGSAVFTSDYELIETDSISAGIATITYNNLDQYLTTYKHLQIRLVVRRDSAVTANGDVIVRFENATSGYAYHELEGDGTNADAASFTSQASIALQDVAVGDAATSSAYGAAIIDILDFNSSSKNKVIRAFMGAQSSSESDVRLQSGLWIGLTPIDVITVECQGDYANNSRISLYGIKA